MKSLFVRGALIVAGACVSGACWASFDEICDSSQGDWVHREYEQCENVPFLSPGNDTRVNLGLLLVDQGSALAQPSPRAQPVVGPQQVQLAAPFELDNWRLAPVAATAPDDADEEADPNRPVGEGSRCDSATDGKRAFFAALGQAKLPREDADALHQAREQLQADCRGGDVAAPPPVVGLESSLGRQFAAYLAGADAFYAGRFDAAAAAFGGMLASRNDWLRSTSQYMIGRSWLNAAINSALGRWGDFDRSKLDVEALKKAEQGFETYLKQYPEAAYVGSARGLLRRIYWLRGDDRALADAYGAMLSTTPARDVPLSIVDEIEYTGLLWARDTSSIHAPALLALVDLYAMRPGSIPNDPNLLTADRLAKQKKDFAQAPELYALVQASYYTYVESQPERVLELVSDALPKQLNYVAFSLQMLRVRALYDSHQPEQARKRVLALLPLAGQPLQSEQLQLTLAWLDERMGQVERVFASDSPVSDPAIRALLVEYAASPNLLRQRIEDKSEDAQVREAATYSLLYRELFTGDYKAFGEDLALVPEQAPASLAPFVAAAATAQPGRLSCPSLRETAASLQQNSHDALGLLCVAEFSRLHHAEFGQGRYARPGKDDLGGHVKNVRPSYSRLAVYQQVIANHAASPELRAFALHRAIYCFATSGYNHCDDRDIPTALRKSWFLMLKREYPDSPWAISLKYYW